MLRVLHQLTAASFVLALMLCPTGATGDDARFAVGASRSIHGQTWTLTRVEETAPMPWSVLDVPAENSVYVAHVGVGKRHRDNVWRYDRDSFRVRARAAFRGHGVELAYRSGRLFVSESRENKFVELDAESLKVKRAYKVGRIPKDFALSGDGRTAFLALWGYGGVQALALKTGETKSVKTGAKTRGIARSADGTLVATNFGADSISFLREAPFEEAAELSLCDAPRHAVFNRSGKRLYVTCHNSDELVVVDVEKRRVQSRVDVAAGPKTVALLSEDRAIIAGEDANAISVVNLDSMSVETLRVPARRPCGVAVSPDRERVYVTAQGSNQLLVFEID